MNRLRPNISIVTKNGHQFLVDTREIRNVDDEKKIDLDYKFNSHYADIPTQNKNNVLQYSSRKILSVTSKGRTDRVAVLFAKLEPGAEMLDDRCAAGQISRDDIHSIVKDIEGTLGEYHRRKLVHLDPRMHNIYVYPDPQNGRLRAKLFNFIHACLVNVCFPYDDAQNILNPKQLIEEDLSAFAYSAADLWHCGIAPQLSLALTGTTLELPTASGVTVLARRGTLQLARRTEPAIPQELVLYMIDKDIDDLILKEGTPLPITLPSRKALPAPLVHYTVEELHAYVDDAVEKFSAEDKNDVLQLFKSVKVGVKSADRPEVIPISDKVAANILKVPNAPRNHVRKFSLWTIVLTLLVMSLFILTFFLQSPSASQESIGGGVALSEHRSLLSEAIETNQIVLGEPFLHTEIPSLIAPPQRKKPRLTVGANFTGLTNVQEYDNTTLGTVYRAKYQGKEVAVLQTDPLDNQTTDILRSLQNLHHPNLAQVIDFQANQVLTYEVFEFVFGISFEDIGNDVYTTVPALAKGIGRAAYRTVTEQGISASVASVGHGLLHYMNMRGVYEVMRQMSSVFEYVSGNSVWVPKPDLRALLLETDLSGYIKLKLVPYKVVAFELNDPLAPQRELRLSTTEVGLLLEAVTIQDELPEHTQKILDTLRHGSITHEQLQAYVTDMLSTTE